MAGKKEKAPVGDKSEQLTAAAVGAGTEQLQAQPKPKEEGAVLVDPDAEAARLAAEQQAAEEARLAAEQQAATAANLAAEGQDGDVLTVEQLPADAGDIDLASLDPANEIDAANYSLVMGVEADQPDWLLGQFDVKAKSPAGFWRCGIQFLHSSATRVFVVTAKADVPHDHDCTIPCCYLTQDEARRVYNDPWLKVLIDSTVIKD